MGSVWWKEPNPSRFGPCFLDLKKKSQQWHAVAAKKFNEFLLNYLARHRSVVLIYHLAILSTYQVFIAQSRSSGSHRDVEDEELTRIFVMIPKTFSEEDLKETFKVRLSIMMYHETLKNTTVGYPGHYWYILAIVNGTVLLERQCKTGFFVAFHRSMGI